MLPVDCNYISISFGFSYHFKIFEEISYSLLFYNLTDSGDYELVSWSRDQTLRLWKMDVQLKKVSECINQVYDRIVLNL